MNKRIILTGLALLCSAFSMSLSAQRIKGSDTMLPLSQSMAEAFTENNKGVQVSVVGGGSGVGITALLDGTTDLAQASRKMKFAERMSIRKMGKKVKEVVAAWDALAVVVHPSNPVSKLTQQQLMRIFTGKVSNWKELGGPDLKIVPYTRETSSGTYEFFRTRVLKKHNFASGMMSMPANGAIIQSVSQTKGAIAYVGLAYLNKDVKAIRVSYDDGKTYVAPSVENAEAHLYPIVRPLYYYYIPGESRDVEPYLKFLFTETGQDIVRKIGFVPVKDNNNE